MKVLYLITARGGSKSVPGKNLRKIGGMSLVGFKAIAARKSKYCTRLMISTDSPEIQEEARRYGVDVPFTRPAELATDTAPSADVIMHAIVWLEEVAGERYDAIMLLEPSSPFARYVDLDNAVGMMIQKDANLVVGVREVEVSSALTGPLDQQGRITQIIDQIERRSALGRQDAPREYTMNGALYLFRWGFFKKYRALYKDREKSYGYVMDRYYSVEVDNMIDLQWAEFLASKGYVDMSYWR